MGKVIEFPCCKGDTVYLVDKAHWKIIKSIVEHIEYVENINADFPFTKVKGEGFCVFFDDFDKIAFHDEEKAKERLQQIIG